MKQVTINIPENKFTFFMELISNLGYAKVNDHNIPEEHKKIVLQRIEAAKKDPSLLLDGMM